MMDRIAPLLALCGFMAALVLLVETLGATQVNPLHLLWSGLALALASIAMWAFWSNK